jgi:hypothetical protein
MKHYSFEIIKQCSLEMHILKCGAHLLNILEEAEPAEGLVTAGTHLHHSSAPQASHTLKNLSTLLSEA